MEKVVRDGKVAVVYSPGFGAGWYTWNLEYPEMIFDPMVVDLVEKNKQEELMTYATLRWPDAYLGGIDDLTVRWIPQGTAFRIHEYDGSESLDIQQEMHWFVA